MSTKIKYTFFVILLVIIACKTDKREEPVQILATVGDKSISVAEFIRRAEYTIRPQYCSGDLYIHKKIILNSLIAEKLFALAAGDSNKLTANKEYQRYLQGRREQAMRQQYFYDQAAAKVKIDSSELKTEYKLSGRTYKLSYFNLPEKFGQEQITNLLSESATAFEDLFNKYIAVPEIPKMEIRYGQPEYPLIYNKLFLADVYKGQVFGPIQIQDGSLFLMRVDGWTDSKVMSDYQARDRMQQVRGNIVQRKALDNFEETIQGLMQGKKLEFNKNTFTALVNAVGPDYFKSQNEKKEAFKKKFWENDNNQMVLDDRDNALAEISERELFTIDGKSWTVRYFEEMLQIHPLVFRQKEFPQTQFAEQLRLAIVDMVRDLYITEDAYEKGFDRHPNVIRNYKMWQDNLLALYRRQAYLKDREISGKSVIEILSDHLEPQAAKLRNKYASQISIDTDLFEEIKLTSIDMFVIQKNVPFPVIVPGFPQLTLHDKLDYGSKLNKEQ